jgi:hypothetical protein
MPFSWNLAKKWKNMSWPFILGGGRFQYEKILMGKSSNNINHTWMDVQLFYYGSWLDGAV